MNQNYQNYWIIKEKYIVKTLIMTEINQITWVI